MSGAVPFSQKSHVAGKANFLFVSIVLRPCRKYSRRVERMNSRFTDNTAGHVRFVFRALVFVLLLVVALPGAMYAQQYSGTITGTVTDPAGAAVAGASVTATNVGTNASYDSTTSDLGVFTFAQLPIGTYDLRVKPTGFKEFVSKGVEVHTSSVTEANVALQLGSASEVVSVEASDVQVQTTTA